MTRQSRTHSFGMFFQSLVEPSMSVKRKVIVPLGKIKAHLGIPFKDDCAVHRAEYFLLPSGFSTVLRKVLLVGLSLAR